MKESKWFLWPGMLLMFLMLVSCGDKTTINNPPPSDLSANDTDGDGLSDIDEIQFYGTSPVFSDTDGDGMNDYTEIIEYGFDADVNPYRFNPLVADVPKMSVNLTSPPSVSLVKVENQEVTKAFEVSRTDESANTVMTSTTDTNTHSIEMTHTATLGFEGWEFQGSYSFSHSTTDETSHSYTHEQAEENRRALTNAEAYEKATGTSLSGGVLMVTLEVENAGNMSFRLDNLILGAAIPDVARPGVFYPVGNLIFDTSGNYVSFPEVTIPPGGKLRLMNFINDSLDLETGKRLLRDTKSLMIIPASYELTDPDGRASAFNMTDIGSKSAMVIIDYAGYLNPETYLVATNADPENHGVTVGKIFEDYLLIPFVSGATTWDGENKTGLLSVRDAGIDETKKGYWLVVHSRDNGLTMVSTEYDMLIADYDFDNLILKAGDVLHLVYIEDKDNDGIYSREEFLRGISDENTDSDGDGLTDDYEIQHRYDPATRDTDGDELNDLADPAPLEKNVYGAKGYFDHTLALKTDGTLFSWGNNDEGQLGIGSVGGFVNIPGQVGSATDWVQIAPGYSRSLALKEDRTIWQWGLHFDGSYYQVTSPTLLAGHYGWEQIWSGPDLSVGIKDDGTMWAWGVSETLFTPNLSETPVLMGTALDNWLHASIGGDFGGGRGSIAAIKDNGTLWGGGGVFTSCFTENFGLMSADSDWTKVWSNQSQTFALKADGTLYASGWNYNGELGITPLGQVCIPWPVGTDWREVATGENHSLGIKTDGTLWAWGDNAFGQLGDPSFLASRYPVKIGTGQNWIKVSAGHRYSIAIQDNGTVWAWGDNSVGQLGIDTATSIDTPQCVMSIIPGQSCP